MVGQVALLELVDQVLGQVLNGDLVREPEPALSSEPVHQVGKNTGIVVQNRRC